jgi:hypothetical protein
LWTCTIIRRTRRRITTLTRAATAISATVIIIVSAAALCPCCRCSALRFRRKQITLVNRLSSPNVRYPTKRNDEHSFLPNQEKSFLKVKIL